MYSVWTVSANVQFSHPHLHQVSQTPLTEDILKEDHVLFVTGIRPQLRRQQGQRLVQPCRGGRERSGRLTPTDGARHAVSGMDSMRPEHVCQLDSPAPAVRTGMASFMGQRGGKGGDTWEDTEKKLESA